MDIPLARKVNGKKFMWDGVVYDSDESAQQVMEDYAKDGFEVEKFVEDGPVPGVFPQGRGSSANGGLAPKSVRGAGGS